MHKSHFLNFAMLAWIPLIVINAVLFKTNYLLEILTFHKPQWTTTMIFRLISNLFITLLILILSKFIYTSSIFIEILYLYMGVLILLPLYILHTVNLQIIYPVVILVYFIPQEGIINKLAFIGTSLMALFSGYSAIQGPFSNLGLSYQKVTRIDIQRIEDQIESLVNSIFEAKKYKDTKSDEMFLTSLFNHLDEMNRDFETTNRLDRWKLYYSYSGYFFSMYCIFKIIQSLFTIMFGRGDGGISKWIEYFLGEFGVEVTSLVGLFMVSLMGMSAVRNLLLHFYKVSPN